MADRGEYRVTYIAAADDPDVHAMTPGAFKLLTMLRLTLPVTGLGVVYPSAMCDRIGCDRVELERLYGELERPTVLRPHGWIRREANVVWIIDGLSDEPSLTPNNTTKHVPYVRRLVANVDQRLAIVAGFRERYHEWFANPTDTDSIGNGKGTDRVPKTGAKTIPFRKGIDTKSSSSSSSNSSGDNSQGERRGRGRQALAIENPLRSLAREAQGLDAMAIADFAVAFYADATEDRQADVVDQLRRLMAGERVPTPFGPVGAYGLKRLTDKCRTVSAERRRLRSADSAIVYLFTKLLDTSDVSQAFAKQLQEQEAEDRRALKATGDQVSAWQRANPERAEAIRAELAAQLPEIPPEPPAGARMTPAERQVRERWEMETAATRLVLSIGVISRISAIITQGETSAGVA